MIMIKMVSCRFEQWFGTFTMFLVKGYSEMGLFRHLSDYVFGGYNFGNTKSLRFIFFFKISKISSRFQRFSKRMRKSFVFLR